MSFSKAVISDSKKKKIANDYYPANADQQCTPLCLIPRELVLSILNDFNLQDNEKNRFIRTSKRNNEYGPCLVYNNRYCVHDTSLMDQKEILRIRGLKEVNISDYRELRYASLLFVY